MTMDDTGRDPTEVELTAAERSGFERLAREHQPDARLEERVVDALRAEGLLRGPGAESALGLADSDGQHHPVRTVQLDRAGRSGSALSKVAPRRGVPAWAAMAAGILLFAVGGWLGHGVGARATTAALLAVREQDAALRIQEAGSAYVRSLASLEQLAGRDGAEALFTQGRQAATSTLLAAALTLSRLDPADPMTPVITQLLQERVAPESGVGPIQQTIWF